MWDVVFGTLCLFFIFLWIGLGPTRWLLSSWKNREMNWAWTMAISPLLGVVFTTLVGTYCVSRDLPIASWGMKWLLTSIIFSSVLLLIRRPTASPRDCGRFTFSQDPVYHSTFTIFLIGLLLCAILILTPILVGGLNFTVLRGNGTDTFNYITMAGYLTHEPLSWVYSTPMADLVAKHPSYSLAYVLFTKTRWSTSMLLGWCSYITHIPLYRFEFGFTTLFYLMLYGVAYCFALSFQLKPRYALLIALAICLGFYGQFVLDVRAMSQISTLPLFVLIALLATAQQNKQAPLWYGGTIATGLTLAALAMLYIELLPTLVLGFFLFFVMRWINQQETLIGLTKKFGLPLLIAIIAIAPIMHYLVGLFLYQLHYASSSKNTWEIAYFSWLYRKPFIGFWGFSIINPSAQHGATLLHHAIKWGLDFMSVVMTGVFFYLLYASLRPKQHPLSASMQLSLALFVAALCQLLYLVLQEQYWAAGKAFTFAFPFLYFMVGGFIVLQQDIPLRMLRKLCQFAVLLWLSIQCSLGFYRILTAERQTFYSNYISPHGEYHAHDWQVTHIAAAIKTQPIQTLGLNIANPWLTEYLAEVFGWDVPVINVSGQRDRGNFLLDPKTIKILPTYFIVAANDPVIAHAEVVAQDPEFVLIRKTHSGEPHVAS